MYYYRYPSQGQMTQAGNTTININMARITSLTTHFMNVFIVYSPVFISFVKIIYTLLLLLVLYV